MKTLNLTLRQRKLLHIVQNQHAITTGQELAKRLLVSPRTIRTDVAEINRIIRPFNAQIHSERSKGYRFEAKDPLLIQQLNQIENAFLTKEDRVRYLALRLCLTEEPLNTYDLEDEIFVSHTTLEHDIHQLKMQYMLSEPYIAINYSKDYLSCEQDEMKIRRLLVNLFHKDWNYQTYGNAYYGYHFLNHGHLKYIMKELPIHLKKYNVILDDPTMVALDLAVVIMFHRTSSGHILPVPSDPTIENPAAYAVTENLFHSLEDYFGCSFPAGERFYIYQYIASVNLFSVKNLTLGTTEDTFDADIIEMANLYLNHIDQLYHIDFKKDEDFFITLLLFIRDLKMEHRAYNSQEITDIAQEQLMDELELAFLFQGIANQYLGHYITRTELQYLAHIISGAIEFLFETNPEAKVKTVICCHLNPPAYWSLKRQILGAYNKYLDVIDLLPVNAQHFYDFSNTDLILSTVQKKITDLNTCDTIRINTILSPKDYLTLSSYIRTKRIEMLCPHNSHTLYEMLSDAYWHESEAVETRFQVLDTLTQDFLKDGIVDEMQVQLLLRKENIMSAATRAGILFLYVPCPVSETKFSVMTLAHRIKWNTHKIRTVILGAFKKEDLSLVFRFNHIFHNDEICTIEKIQMMKTKKELCDYFANV